MKKNRIFLIILVLMLAALGLSACERSASTPPPDENTGDLPLPMAEGTQSVIEVLETNATEIAQPEGEDPAAEEPAAEEPAAEEPAAEEPAADEPAAEEPVAEEPAADEPAAEEPAAEEPAKDYEVPETYTLHAGEFPYCIGRRFNVSPDAIMKASGLTGSNFLPGTVLTIPKDAPPYSGQRTLREHAPYTVKAGDTLYSIACLFGDVYPQAIADANPEVASPDSTLTPGQVLQIP